MNPFLVISLKRILTSSPPPPLFPPWLIALVKLGRWQKFHSIAVQSNSDGLSKALLTWDTSVWICVHMNRLYALYRKLGKVSRRLKQTVTHPETWSRTLSGPAGRLRLLKTPPGPTETQVPGADQYSSIGINQYRQRRDNYQGRISTAIDKRNTETSIGGGSIQL